MPLLLHALGAVAVVITLAAGFFFSPLFRQTVYYESPTEAREAVWETMKQRFILPSGLVMSEPDKTTSESQSYAMLTSVFIGDKETFDLVWGWTVNHLQVRGDALFAWLWEQGGVTDINSATDADQDIAYALILAYERWREERYREEALEIIRDIWEYDTKEAHGIRYVTGGNWALEDPDGVAVNPSYLSPYIYRIFQQYDEERNWMSLVDSSYEILGRCSEPVGIPKDWCRIDNDNRIVKAFPGQERDSDLYSFDAFRTQFRVGLDYRIYGEERAFYYLLKHNSFFAHEWAVRGKILAAYFPDGNPAVTYESLAHYGAQVFGTMVTNSRIAEDIFKKKISVVNFEGEHREFYDLSWVWFGLYFYENRFMMFPNSAHFDFIARV